MLYFQTWQHPKWALAPCKGRRAEWKLTAKTAEPGTIAISPQVYRFPFEKAKNPLPSHLPQKLYRPQSGLLVAPHKRKRPFVLHQAHNGDSAGEERVTAGANVCSVIRRSQYSNAEFGICQVCICLHYLQTAECAPGQVPEKGKERRVLRFQLSH